MLHTPPRPTPSPALLAAAILRAWIRQDQGTLREEFARGLGLRLGAEAQGGDEERVELLQAVVSSLNQCSEARRSEAADPVVRVCVTLLTHLAGQR